MARARILDSPLLLVGPGRAGSALARSWIAAGGKLSAVVARTPGGAARAGRRLGAPGATAADVPARCEILVLAVPDDRIAGVARELSRRVRCRFAFHLSGALPAAALSPLAARGTSVASLHPLRAFTGDSREDWKGALVALEGDAPAVRAGRRIARALGASGYAISAEAKPLYHAAASLAAGGTAALLSIAVRAAADAGLPERRARAALGRLAAEAAEAVAARPFRDAFTGPIARRDVETVRAHRAAAAARSDFFELYRRLAHEILETTEGRGREREIRAILERAGSRKTIGRRPGKRPQRTARRGPGARISGGFARPKGA